MHTPPPLHYGSSNEPEKDFQPFGEEGGVFIKTWIYGYFSKLVASLLHILLACILFLDDIVSTVYLGDDCRGRGSAAVGGT